MAAEEARFNGMLLGVMIGRLVALGMTDREIAECVGEAISAARSALSDRARIAALMKGGD